MTAAVTLGFLAVTTFLWYHVMTGLNTDHLLSGQSAEQTLEIGIKNNLEKYININMEGMKYKFLQINFLLAGLTFLSAELRVVPSAGLVS